MSNLRKKILPKPVGAQFTTSEIKEKGNKIIPIKQRAIDDLIKVARKEMSPLDYLLLYNDIIRKTLQQFTTSEVKEVKNMTPCNKAGHIGYNNICVTCKNEIKKDSK